MVQHHKPVEKLDYCTQGQGHSKGFNILVNVCLDGIFQTTEHSVTKLGMVMQHQLPVCHAEKLVHCHQCQGHWAYIIKMWLFLLYLLNCWSVYNQTSASWARVSCGKIGLLDSGQVHIEGSKCWWMFVGMICSEPQNFFFTRLGMVMQHHEPECHAGKKNWLLSSRWTSQWGLI